MALNFANLLLDIADPISKADKFQWADMPGDPPQVYGKSLDMKAKICIHGTRKADLTIVVRDNSTLSFGPFRSVDAAKKRAEDEYSKWLKNTSMIETTYRV